jgi:hypothetical protein
MFIVDLFESDAKRLVVTYPGRFQPFHQGHADVFASLQARFGSDNVYIVTGNKTDGEKSPFNFSDKVRFMHAAGIQDHNIIESSKVYDVPDAFQSQKDNVIFITAVGAPDAQRLNPGSSKKDGTPSYFQKMPEDMNQLVTADQHGYVIIAEERAKQITIGGKSYDVSHGTPCRALWNQVRNDPKQRAEFIQQLYGRNDPELGKILDKIPTGEAPPAPKPSPRLKKVKEPVAATEGIVINKDDLVDIYLKGRDKKYNPIQKKVGTKIPNSKVDSFIAKVSEKYGLNPKAFVYGPSGVSEDAPPGAKAERMVKHVKKGYAKDGKLTKKEKSIAYATAWKAHNKKQVEEEAGGVGVVASKKQANDPRYSMSLTKDVRPGEIDRQLRKMQLKDSIQRLSEELQSLKQQQELGEGWKQKVAAAALAGSAALGGGAAQADAYQDLVANPIYQVQKVQRDIGNARRNVDHEIWKHRHRAGQDLSRVPYFGIDKVGKAIAGRGEVPGVQDRSPGWEERAARNAQRQAEIDQARAERQERQERQQWGRAQNN